jgi:hypothetical protein
VNGEQPQNIVHKLLKTLDSSLNKSRSKRI